MNSLNSQLKTFAIILAAFILAYIYSGHFKNGFFYDDVYLIQQNPAIQSLNKIPIYFTDISTHGSRVDYHVYYRPMLLVSFAIDWWLGKGPNTMVFHIHTFIGFIALILLVFFFCKKLFGHFVADPFYLSLLVCCLFAFHPAVADVINYHTGRDCSFSTLYGMLYMVLYLYSPFARKYYLHFIPMLIGCLFKVTTIMFMPVLWLYIIYFESEVGLNGIVTGVKQTFRKMLPEAIITLTIAAIVYFKSKPESVGIEGVTRFTYLLTQAHVLLNYFTLFFVPDNLNPNAWHDFVTSPADTTFISGFLFVVLLCAAIYVLSLRKSTRLISFGLAWFIIVLLPESSILPLRIPQNDYRMFPAMIGLCIAFAGTAWLVIEKLKGATKAITVIVTIVCIVFNISMAYASHQRVHVWSSDELMWEDVIKKDPTNGRVLMNLGVELIQQGNIKDAEQYFERAKSMSPYYDLIYVNLGIIKNLQSDTTTARQDFEEAVAIHGFDYTDCCFFYARYLNEHNQSDKAVPLLLNGLTENPGVLNARYLLMDIYSQHRNKELGNACRQTLQLFPGDNYAQAYLKQYSADSSAYVSGGMNPDDVMEKDASANPTADKYITLSLSYFKEGKFEKVVEVCKKAIALEPKSALAYNNMCAAYNNLKQWDKAIEAGQQALKLDPKMALAQNNLNFALQQKKINK